MKFRKVLVVFVGLVLSVFCFTSGQARVANASRVSSPDPAPLAMLKSISNRMFSELDKYRHRGNLKNNPRLVNSLVNRIVVPNFDLQSMSRAVVGGSFWQSGSSQVQQEFITQFTEYVIRTYSSAMQSYDGETMKFYPIRGAVGDRVQISSDLLLKSGPPIQLQYSVSRVGGGWKIYDFSVDGVSIVKNYNSQFASTLRQKGLSGLVQDLKKQNTGKYR